MPALGSLYPNSDVQLGEWYNGAYGTTTGDYFASVDEAISSPDDTNYITAGINAQTTDNEFMKFGLTNMPSDFNSISSLSYNFRYRQVNRTDDTLGLSFWVEKSDGTNLTNIVSISNITTTTFTNTGATAFTITIAGTSATKAEWDAAVLVIRYNLTTSMANDQAVVRISAIELTGNYNAASSITRTATGSGTGSSSASGTISKLRTATGSGTGSGTGDDVIVKLRTASASGTGSGTATRVIVDIRTATGSGVGSSSASGLVTRVRTATGSGTGSGTATIPGGVSRTASGSGTGSSSATRIVSVIRTASSSGVGSGTADGLTPISRTASASGTGSSSATGIKITVVGPTSGTGTGSSSALVLVTSIRTASASGVGSSVIVSGKAISRTGFSGAYAPEGQALWANAGRSLMEEVRMPPFWVDKQPRIIRRRR